MRRLLTKFIDDESGATAIEYALIAVLIALGILVGVGNTADAIQSLWGNNNEGVTKGLNIHPL